MHYKILILDEGVSVPKLVRSILDGHPFDIDEGSKSSSIKDQIKKYQSDLLMLDFNYSLDEDAYSIAKNIKKDFPNLKLLLVYGTFDQPDRLKMQEVGVDDFIYKPFDGKKLITACMHLVGLETTKHNIENNMNQEIFVAAPENNDNNSKLDLDNEISQWKMSIPDIISKRDNDSEEMDDVLVPSILGANDTSEHKASNHPTQAKHQLPYDKSYPSDSDLEYPEEQTQTTQTLVVHSVKPQAENESGEKTELVDLAQITSSQKDLLGKLKAQIKDEVENDFWNPEDADVLHGDIKQDVIGSSKVNAPGITDSEELFQKVEIQALKQEVLGTIRSQMLKELRAEIMDELRQELITNLSDSERIQILNELKNNFFNEIRSKLYEEIKAELILNFQENLLSELKVGLLNNGEIYLDKKVSEYFKKEAVPRLQEKLPDLAQEYIKEELLRIRRLME